MNNVLFFFFFEFPHYTVDEITVLLTDQTLILCVCVSGREGGVVLCPMGTDLEKLDIKVGDFFSLYRATVIPLQHDLIAQNT